MSSSNEEIEPQPPPRVTPLSAEEREVALVQYDNAGEIRNTDVFMRWTIGALMCALNSGLLVFMVPAILDGKMVGWILLAAQSFLCLSLVGA